MLDAANIERPLGPTEEMYWRFDAVSPINFGTLNRLTGDVNIEQLQHALGALQRRHPLLRVTVERDNRGAPWFRTVSRPVPLRVEALPPDEIWRQLEAEVNIPFAPDGPLMRCVLLRHGERDSTLLMIFHHAISDGKSSVFLMRDLLQSLARMARGDAPDLLPLPPVGYYGDRVPVPDARVGIKNFRTAFKTVRAVLTFLEGAGVPTALPHVINSNVPLAAQKLVVEPRVIDADLLARLARRAKAEQTTIQCVLNAALSLTVVTESPTRSLERTACTQVLDMRERLVPPVGEDCGCFASGATSLHPLKHNTPFWPLTRRIHEQLQNSILTPLPFFYALLHRNFIRVSRRLGVTRSSTFSEIISRLHPEGLAVSNLGRVVIEADGSPLTVTDYAFATNTVVLNHLSTSAATMNGRMTWTFNGSSMLGRELIARIADGAIARIVRALEE